MRAASHEVQVSVEANARLFGHFTTSTAFVHSTNALVPDASQAHPPLRGHIDFFRRARKTLPLVDVLSAAPTRSQSAFLNPPRPENRQAGMFCFCRAHGGTRNSLLILLVYSRRPSLYSLRCLHGTPTTGEKIDRNQRFGVDPPTRHLSGRASVPRRVCCVLPGPDSPGHPRVGGSLVFRRRRRRHDESGEQEPPVANTLGPYLCLHLALGEVFSLLCRRVGEQPPTPRLMNPGSLRLWKSARQQKSKRPAGALPLKDEPKIDKPRLSDPRLALPAPYRPMLNGRAQAAEGREGVVTTAKAGTCGIPLDDGASEVAAAFGRIRLAGSPAECRAAAEFALDYCRRVRDSPSAPLHWRIPLKSKRFLSSVGR